MRNVPTRILLAGGGSGGSVTPVIAVAEALRELEPGVRLLLVGTSEGPERGLAAAAGLHFAAVPSGKLRRYLSWQNFVDPFLVLGGMGVAARLVRRLRPQAAFGAGGFASAPPLAAAAVLGCPVHIHQQDAEPGLANRLLIPFARRCSVSLPASIPYFPPDRTILAGNPVRRSIFEGRPVRTRDAFGLDPALPIVLVTGGGTGALGLNRIVAEAAPLLAGRCQLVHLTGRGRAVPLDRSIAGYRQIEFVTHEMADLLAAATLVVTRAGMGTLAELAALGKPTALVPMPRSHQTANAAAFASRGAVVVWEQARLTGPALADAILALLAQPARLAELGENIRAAMPAGAAERLAAAVLDLARAR